ncbi:unnamed protein product [Symbiodinium sp. CCMP2592]|nr:unnamed protein product [Symbiodinium sp. CCMP2592]
MQPHQGSDLANHSKNKKHMNALEELQAAQARQAGSVDDSVPEPAARHGIVSGLTTTVPRMDTWVAALNGVLKRASFESAVDDAASGSVGSSLLGPEADSSSTVTRKLLQCLRAPLDEEDLWAMQNSVASSIGIDKGGVYLVAYARTLTKAGGLYEFLLGIDSNTSPDSDEADAARVTVEALKRILLRAATKRGTQRRETPYFGPDDVADDRAAQAFCDSVVSITADGGPTEQRAAYECSPRVGELVGVPGRQALFPHCGLITRDRAHRVRSVQKLFFSKLPPVFQEFINSLMLGPRSLCSLIQQSEKFRKAFTDKQKKFRSAAGEEELETAIGFSNLIKSMSFADHRFDSRIRPLHRLFRLLVVVLAMLEDIASGRGPWQPEDKAFATELLLQFSGDQGFNVVVSAALVADTMIVAAPFLRVADESNADFALSADAAAKCLADLRHLLKDGGIWLPQAKDTLVHGVLRAIKDKLIFCGEGSKAQAVAIRFYAIFEAFFKSHFPGYEEANCMVLFNLQVELSLSDREKFTKSLAERLGLDGGKAWESIVGNGRSTGLLAQARYWNSPAGIAAAGDEKGGPHRCHPPESPHQKAWLRVWKDLSKQRSDCHKDAKRLIEFYLASLSGTGTIERFIGCIGSLKTPGRNTVHDRSLEASLKLLQQDLHGRRRERLSPKSLLSKDAPATTSGGATVLHPATPYLLKCQRLYSQWFGERASVGRSLEVASLADLGKSMVQQKKPRLKASKACSKSSEAEQLKQHTASCNAAVAQIKSGDVPETVLGTVLPAPGPTKNMLGDMADEAWQMRKRRKLQDAEPKPVPDVASSSASTPSAMAALLASKPASDNNDVDGLDWSKAVAAVKKQAEVAEKRAAAQAAAVPGQPASFVDSTGGSMLVKPEGAPLRQPAVPKALPLHPTVLLGEGVRKSRRLPLPSGCVFTNFPKTADIVLVSSVTAAWETAEALLARLEGAWLQDLENRKVKFNGSMHKQHFIFFITGSFAAAHPQHSRALQACCERSPLMKSATAKAHVKRLEVHSGTVQDYVGHGKKLLYPKLTYELVVGTGEAQRETQHQAEGELRASSTQQLDLRQLLSLCGRCVEAT